MLKKESDRVIKIPKGEYAYQEDDRPNKYPVLSEEELKQYLEKVYKREKRIRCLTNALLERDTSYGASGEPNGGRLHAYRICAKALYPDEEIVSVCCRLPLIYDGTPKSCTVRCPNGCIEEHFIDLDTWK